MVDFGLAHKIGDRKSISTSPIDKKNVNQRLSNEYKVNTVDDSAIDDTTTKNSTKIIQGMDKFVSLIDILSI